MIEDEKIFSLIVKNTVFTVLKEKYPNCNIDDSKDDVNIDMIFNLLLVLEKYAHIADKKTIVKEVYHTQKASMLDGSFKESDFLKFLKGETEELSFEEKDYILNTVIFVTNHDGKISSNEKEVILQVSRSLGIDYSYIEIMKLYDKSEFKVEDTPYGLIIAGIFILSLAFGYIFWKANQEESIQAFKTNKYQFDEITFNRYIIYKNQNNVENKYFKKYAIFYLSGTAYISFNPEDIVYNSMTKTLTLSSPFKIELNVKQDDKIDEVKPKSISEEDAKKAGFLVGIAGAYAGGKVGNELGSILPKPYKFLGSTLGSVAGGAAGYFATSSLLEGVKLTDDISMTSKKETLKIGEELIKAQLKTDEQMNSMYKEHFESFIKSKYRTLNKEVEIIKYKKEAIGEIK